LCTATGPQISSSNVVEGSEVRVASSDPFVWSMALDPAAVEAALVPGATSPPGALVAFNAAWDADPDIQELAFVADEVQQSVPDHSLGIPRAFAKQLYGASTGALHKLWAVVVATAAAAGPGAAGSRVNCI
jgi:hypothetical protein